MQSLVFLLAGFDTTATTLTNTVFLLARNPEIQNRLYQETMRKRHQFVSLIFLFFKELCFMPRIC